MASSHNAPDFRRVFEGTLEIRALLDSRARLVSVSDGFCRTFALSRAELCSRTLYDLPPYAARTDLREQLQRHLARVFEVGARRLFQPKASPLSGRHESWIAACTRPIFGASGAVEFVSHTWLPAGAAGVHTSEHSALNALHARGASERGGDFDDVDQHAVLQRHLQQTNEQLRLTLRAARAITWSIRRGDPTAALVEWGSDDFLEFFGVGRELVPLGPLAVVHPDDREKVRALTVASFETGRDLTTEFRGYSALSGATRYYACHGRVMPSEQGGAPRMLGVTWDISERQRMLEERVELDRHLRETQKLESLGVLAGGIAHDFNNLLTTVLGNVSLAQKQVDPTSPVSYQLRNIDDAARHAAELCMQMLAYAGRAEVVLAPVSLNRLVEDAKLLQVSLQKKVALRFALTPDLPSIIADATQLRQVLINLVINAAEAIGSKPGHITVRTGIVHGDARLLERALVAPDAGQLASRYVFLEVADDGPGMDDATLSRIFEPFFTTKFTGRGLGLSAVLGIVRGHSGVLKVQSRPNAGSKFLMALPMHEEPHLAPSSSSKGRSMDKRGKLEGTILLVDDDARVRAVTRTMLEVLGLHVIVARDGREGINTCVSRAAELTLVLMDLTMPEIDGEEALRELRRRGVRLPVLLMSGYSEYETRERLAGYGPFGFLQKPFGLAQLRTRLLELVDA